MDCLFSRSGAFLAGVLILACTAASRPIDAVAPVTLGTFDSRAVAIAWFHSPAGQDELAGLHEELAAAQAAGDEDRVAALEAQGPELQARLHRMAFSTAPVGHLIELIRDDLKTIAAEAGVDAIVSKWDVVYQAPGTTFVDVTDALILAFGPEERGLRAAREVMGTKPVPLDELEEHEH